MSDLISRQVAIDALKKQQAYFSPQDEPLVYYEYRRAINAIKNLSYIQPEIIRCENCTHMEYGYCDKLEMRPDDNFFCGYGERKDD